MKRIDPILEAFTPDIIRNLQRADLFWLTVLSIHSKNGITIENAFIDLNEFYFKIFGCYRFSDVRAARLAWKNFQKRNKERNILLPAILEQKINFTDYDH